MPEGTELARLWLGPSAAPEDAANNSASTLLLAAAGHAVQTDEVGPLQCQYRDVVLTGWDHDQVGSVSEKPAPPGSCGGSVRPD